MAKRIDESNDELQHGTRGPSCGSYRCEPAEEVTNRRAEDGAALLHAMVTPWSSRFLRQGCWPLNCRQIWLDSNAGRYA